MTGRWLLTVLLAAGCVRPAQTVVLASTTSTEDSGLFDTLLPAFEKANPRYHIAVVAVGSGQALAMARRGDADVLLVHSPAAESTFMAGGYGDTRRSVMYNDFVILGDPTDRAGVRGSNDAAAALRRIAETNSPFVSRGDQSGTHTKELALWKAAGLLPADSTPDFSGYRSVGQGMGETLGIANEKHAYTLSDRGTYLSMRAALALQVLVEGDRRLRNPYSVITVRQAMQKSGARAFADWIVSPAAQNVIGSFGVDKFGQRLFTPSADTSQLQ
jgi:tungstate transport system substrate-binding protein